MIVVDLLRIKYKINKTNFILNDNQMKMLTNFIFCICKNCGIYMYYMYQLYIYKKKILVVKSIKQSSTL